MIEARRSMPPHGAFEIDRTMASTLVELIGKYRPLRVLELGSGLSTLYLGYALEANGCGDCYSMEHHPFYYERTKEWIDFHGLGEWVQLIHAPLTHVEIDGARYKWYDPARLPDCVFDFVYVDGPPAHIGILARWPAYFMLLPQLSKDCIIVCDDAYRQHERVMIADWIRHSGGMLEETRVPGDHGGVMLCRRMDQIDKEEACPHPKDADP